MLKMMHIEKSFNIGTINEKKVLNDLNLTINDGDFITVIGGNGAGKSTMLNTIAGVYRVDGGRIFKASFIKRSIPAGAGIKPNIHNIGLCAELSIGGSRIRIAFRQ